MAFTPVGAGAGADHAAVPFGIRRFGGQDGHGRLLGQVKITYLGDGLRANQGDVAGEHQDVFVSLGLFAGAHDGVSGAPLVSLQDKLHAGVFHRGTHAFRLMTDYHVDVPGGYHLSCRGYHVRQERAAADFVENLGPFGFEPRALSRRHNDNGEGWRVGYILPGHEEIILTP